MVVPARKGVLAPIPDGEGRFVPVAMAKHQRNRNSAFQIISREPEASPCRTAERPPSGVPISPDARATRCYAGRRCRFPAVHRPRAEAARSAPAPEPSERPQQELLSPEQGGPPIAGREPSPELYVRPVKIPELDSFEPRTKPNPQRISVRPLLPRMSEVELRMGTSIGEGINSYTLDKPVADLSHGSLWEFCDFEYAACRKDFGIQRKLPGEVFYRAADNVFLAKQSVPAIVAALNGKVCRIYFGFAHMTDEECWEFLRKAGDYLGAKYGSPSDTHEINRECKWVSWDRSFGKVSLETDSFWRRSALIYTSSALRPQNITWFRRIFGNR